MVIPEAKFHLIVARWLKLNSYRYDYEVRMPEYGRADFVATHADGHTMIVECKVASNAQDGRSALQLVDYCRQMPHSQGGFAIPADLVSDKVCEICDYYHVKLLPIEVNEAILAEVEVSITLPWTSKRQPNEETLRHIKAIARRQMIDEGTGALSLRGIAREMGVTAPALYRYYPSLDDLITALLLDAFNGMADAMGVASASLPTEDYGGRLMAAMAAYRAWALDNPIDFQLAYGNPIPGYDAPAALTIPAASRSFQVVVDILGGAHAAGILQPPPEYVHVPPTVEAQLTLLVTRDGYPVQPVVLYIAAVGWTRIHGMVALELLDHLPPVVGDTGAFYHFETLLLCKHMGLTPQAP